MAFIEPSLPSLPQVERAASQLAPSPRLSSTTPRAITRSTLINVWPRAICRNREKWAAGKEGRFSAGARRYTEFHKIQREARIELPCRDADNEGHECNGTCDVCGCHAFRYACARFNHEHPQLQRQMGHTPGGDDEPLPPMGRRLVEYEAYVPAALESGKLAAKQREDAGKKSGKPRLRVVGA